MYACLWDEVLCGKDVKRNKKKSCVCMVWVIRLSEVCQEMAVCWLSGHTRVKDNHKVFIVFNFFFTSIVQANE